MPNNDYILRGNALKAVCENCSMHGDEGEPCSSRCEDYALVLKIPAADVELVRHGRWIPINRSNPVWSQFGIKQHKCSECGCEEESARKRCPECGAKLEE